MAGQKLFWGLQIESGKAYAQTVGQSFAIRQAVLQTKKDASSDGMVKLFAKYENTEFLLCILSAADVETRQVPLNVKFETGAQLSFRVEGSQNVSIHLTGYCIPSVSAPGTPSSSAIAVPFEGSQRSILVSTKKGKKADDSKSASKRVSIDDGSSTPKKVVKGNKSVSFVDEDDLNFIKNGLPESDGDEDDDDEDDEDYTTEDDFEDGMEAFSDQLKAQLTKKLKQEKGAVDDDDDEDDDDDDGDDDDDDDDDDDEDDEELEFDMDDDDDDDDEEEDDEDIGVAIKSKATSTPKSPAGKEGKLNKKNGNEVKTPETPKNQKKGKDAKTPETPKSHNGTTELKTPEGKGQSPKVPSSAGSTPMKFVAKGGVMVQEMRVGNGPVAKGGRMVSVYYWGRLKQNNKLFDKSEKGPGFKFRLGKGEVIRGWDIGVEGMKVGGKRKLIIPANLAYGKRGAPPDIPPNSTLVFDVELKNVS